MTANIDPYTMMLDEYYRYLEKLEVKYQIDQTLQEEKQHKAEHGTNEDSNKLQKKRSRKDKKGTLKKSSSRCQKVCVHCKKWHPAKALSAKAKKTKKSKRKVSYQTIVDSDDNSLNSTESDNYHCFNTKNDYNYDICDALCINKTNTKNKNSTVNRLTTEVVVEELSPKGKVKPIRCLLDTGTTTLKNFVTLGQIVTKNKRPITWKSLGGSFVTKKSAKLSFKIPELSTSKLVTWTCHIDETSDVKKVLPYD